MDQLPGTNIGRYRLEELLGQSEFAGIFRAYDVKLERTVDLKLILRSREYASDFADYFVKQARALAQLSHPGIVKVLDFGQDQGYLYLVTEHVEGQPLSALTGQPVDWREAARITIALADALEYAHRHGVIHRDLKPGNIILNPEGQPVISDFGVAHIIEVEETREVTGTNVGLGTPAYMSPEQGKGMSVDYRADIYSLGVVLFELATGQKPFNALSGMEVVIQQVTLAPPSPREIVPDLPPVMEKIILTALKKDPDERYQSMEALAQALQQALAGGSSAGRRGRRPAWLPVGIGLAVVLLAGGALAGLYLTGRLGAPAQPAPVAQAATLTPAAPLPSATAAVEATSTPKPAAAAAAPTPTAQPTAAPTGAAAAAPQRRLPRYPLLPGAWVPDPKEKISAQNAAGLTEMARLGNPYLSDIAWLPSGQELAAGTSAGVYFYSRQALNAKDFFDAKGWITTTAVSPDGTVIATGDRAGQVRLWDALTGQELARLEGHSAEIRALAFSPDGALLASGANDHLVKVWDVDGKRERYTLKKHALAVSAVRFSTDGSTLYSTGEDFQLVAWSMGDGSLAKQMSAGQSINGLGLDANSSLVALALKSARVELWDVETGKKTGGLADPVQVLAVNAAAFSPGGQLLVTGSDDGVVRVFSVSNGALLRVFQVAPGKAKPDPQVDGVVRIAFSPDGSRLAILTRGNRVDILNSSTLQQDTSREFASQPVRRVSISPDRETIAIQTGEQKVTVYRQTGVVGATLAGVIAPGNPFSDDSKMLALSAGEGVKVYNPLQPGNTAQVEMVGYQGGHWLSFLPGGKILATAGIRSLLLWATNSGHELSSDAFRYDGNCQVARADDDSFLAAGSDAGVFASDEAAVGLCKVPRNPRTRSTATSADGRFLAFGLQTGSVEVWSSADGFKAPFTLDGGKKDIAAVAFSPGGDLLAAASLDGKVRIWSLADQKLITTFEHHTAAANSLEFSADGTWLATGSADGTVEVWGAIK